MSRLTCAHLTVNLSDEFADVRVLRDLLALAVGMPQQSLSLSIGRPIADVAQSHEVAFGMLNAACRPRTQVACTPKSNGRFDMRRRGWWAQKLSSAELRLPAKSWFRQEHRLWELLLLMRASLGFATQSLTVVLCECGSVEAIPETISRKLRNEGMVARREVDHCVIAIPELLD